MATSIKDVLTIKVELGHRADFKGKIPPNGFTHDWTVFVRGQDGANIHHFVEKVIFHLHETFNKPKIVIYDPPYEVSESGYTGFVMNIEIFFRIKNPYRKINFEYDLFLNAQGAPAVTNVRLEKLKFQNPSEDFRQKLLKAGASEYKGEKKEDIGKKKEEKGKKKEQGILQEAGGSFQDLPFVYAADDHLSDNDGANKFPDTSPLVADSGDREGRRLSQTKANDPTACDNSDNNSPPKRPKLEPEDEYPITTCADGEDRGTQDKEVRGTGPGSPGSCLGAGVPLPRTSPYWMQPPPLPTSLGAQPGASLHRFPTGQGPPPALSVISPSSIPAQGVEGPQLNGHSLGGGIVGGTATSSHAGHLQRVPTEGVVVEEDVDWMFGRYIIAELKKIKSFKDKQLTKMRIQQIVTYAQLGMGEQSDGNSACSHV